jgi:hypothetical protein
MKPSRFRIRDAGDPGDSRARAHSEFGVRNSFFGMDSFTASECPRRDRASPPQRGRNGVGPPSCDPADQPCRYGPAFHPVPGILPRASRRECHPPGTIDNAGQPVGDVQGALVWDRRLDAGNPNPGNIGSDFNRFDFTFWRAPSSRDGPGTALGVRCPCDLIRSGHGGPSAEGDRDSPLGKGGMA